MNRLKRLMAILPGLHCCFHTGLAQENSVSPVHKDSVMTEFFQRSLVWIGAMGHGPFH